MLTRLFILILLIAVSACIKHSRDPLLDTNMNVDVDKTLEYLQEIETKKQKDPQVYYQLSRIYFEKANYTAALEKVHTAIKLRQNDPDYFYEQGKILQQLHRPEECIKSMLTAEALGNKNLMLYQILAEEYLQIGQPEKGREAAERLLAIERSGVGYALKGNIVLSLGDTTAATSSYKRALEMDPDNLQANHRLADISLSRGDYQNAGSYINELLRAAPGNLSILEKKAILMQQVGELDSARALFKYLIAERSSHVDYFNLSKVYYGLYQYDSAKAMADKAFEMNKDLLEARVIVARSLEQQRNYGDAMEVYKSIIATDSTYNLAAVELDNLQRKVAYLWRLELHRRAVDSATNNLPPTIEKKGITDN